MISIGSFPKLLGYICFGSGVGTVGFITAFFCHWLFDIIVAKVKYAKWKHKYNHRFDKSPTAKCYCIDCEHYGANNEFFTANRDACLAHKGWRVADEWFCWCANPCEKDPEQDGEERKQ